MELRKSKEYENKSLDFFLDPGYWPLMVTVVKKWWLEAIMEVSMIGDVPRLCLFAKGNRIMAATEVLFQAKEVLHHRM